MLVIGIVVLSSFVLVIAVLNLLVSRERTVGHTPDHGQSRQRAQDNLLKPHTSLISLLSIGDALEHCLQSGTEDQT
jgi:hypothetical protein